MKKKNLALVIVVAILFSSCADAQHNLTGFTGEQYGFFSGIWHGMIAPISFVCSLLDDSVAVWAVNNTGGWYTFGFLLGVGAFASSASKASN